ncbi:alpha-xylosidase [Mollicutes bacterium LVI A0039]|nr:alpha-xylosidase [Mollicutes bacterium LVI A0039]
MKFKKGMWMPQEGFTLNYPSTVYEYKLVDNKLYIYCPFVEVHHRGNTLDGGMLTGEISIFDNNVHFNFYHKKQFKKSKFNVNRRNDNVSVNETEELIILSNGNVSVEITKQGFKIDVINLDGTKISIPERSFGYMVHESGNTYVSSATKLGVGEKVYGFGEKFTNYVKNGQVVEVWHEDGGTASEQTYKSIPFYLTTNNYGVFVDHSDKVDFEVGSEAVGKTQFAVAGEVLRFDIITGTNVSEVAMKFSKLGGDMPRVPEWSYGLWLSTSFTTEYNEETVLEFIDGMDSRNIPFEVFHFDCFWMKEYEWMNFEWNKDLFPDPEGLMKKIHDRGKKVCVWINPYIGQKAAVFDECYQNGYFVGGKDNLPWQWDRWQAGMGLIDFTNPEAKEWYKNKLRMLVKMGVDSFKTDFGERIPVPSRYYETDVVEYFDKSNPEEMHNYYTYLYNEAVFEVLQETQGEGQACLFARSGTFGQGKLPVHWGGDCLSNYESMAESLRGGLSLSLSGYAYWSHDIGGFEAGCTPDIYKRWTQFGLLSSHSRYHGNSEYKVPWFYGEEAVEVSRKFAKLKNSLMPYIKEMENEVIELGLPMIRPMLMDYNYDRNAQDLDRQYMFGSKLLVAPIFNDQSIAEYYLPTNTRWYNILTEEVKAGGSWYKETFDYLSLPLLLKSGEAIALSDNTDTTKFDVDAGFKVLAFDVIERRELSVISNNQVKVIVIENNQVIENAGLDFELIIIK